MRDAYGEEVVYERHRHRYELNNRYRQVLEEHGMVLSGTSPDGLLVEFIELPRRLHPFFVATQAHPEFKSRPNRPHPLFAAFVAAALERAEGRRPATADRRDGARARQLQTMRRMTDDLSRCSPSTTTGWRSSGGSPRTRLSAYRRDLRRYEAFPARTR